MEPLESTPLDLSDLGSRSLSWLFDWFTDSGTLRDTDQKNLGWSNQILAFIGSVLYNLSPISAVFTLVDSVYYAANWISKEFNETIDWDELYESGPVGEYTGVILALWAIFVRIYCS